MKKIILSVLALISCFSLGSCSNEEKPLKTIQLKENQTLKIDKYELSFGYTDCYYCRYEFDDEHGSINMNNILWYDAKLQSLPFAYTTIIFKVYSNSLTISVDFNNEALDKLYEDSRKYMTNIGGSLFNGESTGLYISKDQSQASLGVGILIDSKNSTFIYSPESFDYSDYTLTFNANTTPYELKEVSK